MENAEITKVTEYPEQEKPHPAFEVHKVLDHGFIRLVDSMPSPTDPYSIPADAAIVQAARVSYGKGTKTVNEDKGLIGYLMKHRHTTPFEMVEFKFHARMPMFVARQWIRHRTANVNEYSARYSEVPDLCYIPEESRIMGQSKSNKQSSEGFLFPQTKKDFIGRMQTVASETYQDYQEFLAKGVSRETARMLLPVAYYTEWYWKIDLHNLFHFISLRYDPHAQQEIQVYAEAMYKICKELAPVATEALDKYRRSAVTLDGDEIGLVKALINPDNIEGRLTEQFERKGWSPRRRKEFLETLNKIIK
jgi:thymidylate synthase (FAD)